jgi:hypothetical protein
VVNTSNVTDESTYDKFPFLAKPNCSVYAMDYKEKKLDFSRIDFIIEFKSGSDDPFIDGELNPNPKRKSGGKPESGKDPNPELQSGNPFACSEGCRLQILGQITAYATLILSAQYRTHTFMVFIVKDYARLLRWDRGGAIVTEPIYFNNDSHLLDFFIRYDIADPKVRGHDSTVSLPNNDEIELAKATVPELAKEKSFLAVEISDQRYIICGPKSRPYIPVGRWTRTSFAYDIERKRRVFLKDSWRVLMDDIQPEGEIYERLHQNNVPNIPLCLVAGDIGDDTYHQSRAHEFIEKCLTHTFGWKITPHRHYRIVLGTVGRRLDDFKCTKEFVTAMYDALRGEMTISLAVSLRNLTHIIAHEQAWKIGILHRDISASNILIVDNGELNPEEMNEPTGMLIDWDLSKSVTKDDGPTTARQYTRTVS